MQPAADIGLCTPNTTAWFYSIQTWTPLKMCGRGVFLFYFPLPQLCAHGYSVIAPVSLLQNAAPTCKVKD